MNPRLHSFTGGSEGLWTVTGIRAAKGESLPNVDRLDVVNGASTGAGAWVLRGVTSNERYATQAEKSLLTATQAPIGRAESTHAALIPIRKSAAWWAMPQDERRLILEEASQHIRIGIKYLPGISRRLHHCRDLETAEPFDFLTWFDFAPQHAQAFEELVGQLRATEEWKYVEREVDVRLTR